LAPVVDRLIALFTGSKKICVAWHSSIRRTIDVESEEQDGVIAVAGILLVVVSSGHIAGVDDQISSPSLLTLVVGILPRPADEDIVPVAAI
jgi:hypothetical protein